MQYPDLSTGYGRVPVTAGSICEVTVFTSYGSTQDDEHLCGNKKQSLWFCGLQVLKEHNYVRDSTYMYLVR